MSRKSSLRPPDPSAMPHKLFHDFVTLFVVVNPIANVPFFIAIAGHENRER